jgi:hypothetical protein
MTSDLQSNKARDVVLLVGLVFFVLTGLGTEIVSCEATSRCILCEGQRSEQTRYWSVWGAPGSSQTHYSLQPSRFLEDFPEFQCQHLWSDISCIYPKIWDSPLIELNPSRRLTHVWTGCCCDEGYSVLERYEIDEIYRESIQELLKSETTTRQQLLVLVNEQDTDEEVIHTPEEESILKILYSPPFGSRPILFRPLGLPFVEDSSNGNDRPPI